MTGAALNHRMRKGAPRAVTTAPGSRNDLATGEAEQVRDLARVDQVVKVDLSSHPNKHYLYLYKQVSYAVHVQTK